LVGLGLIFFLAGALLSNAVVWGWFPTLTPLVVANTKTPFRLLLLSVALFVIGFTLTMLGIQL
jgi:hypothetical protein